MAHDHEEIRTITFEDGHSVNLTTAAVKEKFGVDRVEDIDPEKLKEFHEHIDRVRAMTEPKGDPVRVKPDSQEGG